MRNAANPADDIEEQLAAARANLTEDVRSATAKASALTDWRHHFQKHPCLFASVTAALGFVLTPRRRREASTAVSSPAVSDESDSRHSAGLSDAIARSRNSMLQASVASLAVAIVEEGLILGVRRGLELLNHPLASEQTAASVPKSSQAVSSENAPEAISNGQAAPSRLGIGTAESQHAVEQLRQHLKSAMADHPKASLIAAAAAGVVLGWTVKRK